MTRRTYADEQWLSYLRQTGGDLMLETGLLDCWFVPSWRPERSIMARCLCVPAAYWPQVVDEECEKLLAAGMGRETVRKIRQWLERELTISP